MAIGRGGSTSPTSVRRLEAAQRRVQALRLRLSGHSFDEIARQLGYARRNSAHDAVMAALRETTREPAEQLRELELQRLDALLAGLWQKAIGGNLFAVDRALAVAERRAKLLGLDAPVQVNLYAYVVQMAEAAGLDEAEAVATAERIIAGRRP